MIKDVIELWMPIKDWEGFYEISNLGIVKSVNRKVIFKDGRIANYKERILKTGINSDGYRCAGLCKNSVQSNPTVHGLVGHHFVAGYNPGFEINHIDGDKLNNAFWNLEWGTHEHNVHHAIATGLFVPGKQNSMEVIDRKGQVYKSIKHAARINGINPATLRSRIRTSINKDKSNFKVCS